MRQAQEIHIKSNTSENDALDKRGKPYNPFPRTPFPPHHQAINFADHTDAIVNYALDLLELNVLHHPNDHLDILFHFHFNSNLLDHLDNHLNILFHFHQIALVNNILLFILSPFPHDLPFLHILSPHLIPINSFILDLIFNLILILHHIILSYLP